MKKRPYFVCSKCGKYNDVLRENCVCGQALNVAEYEVYEGMLPIELCGDVDISVPIYIQKCPKCTRANFTSSADKPVEECRLCRNHRIANESEPMLFDCETPVQPKAEPVDQPQIEPVSTEAQQQAAETRIEEDNFWASLLGVDYLPKDDVYATVGKTTGSSPVKPSIQLKNIAAFPFFSQTFSPEETEILIGRDAQCADYLYGKDGRVSNEHCYLVYRDGKWYVRDCSRNGTQINGRLLPKGAEIALPDQAELKLGHWSNSIGFKVHYIV